MLTEKDIERIRRIFEEATRDPRPMRIYPDDAIFLVLWVQKLSKRVTELESILSED